MGTSNAVRAIATHAIPHAVAALAADPNVLAKSGRVFTSWGLAQEYGFTDTDGRRPHWDRDLRELGQNHVSRARRFDEGFYAYWGGLSEESA